MTEIILKNIALNAENEQFKTTANSLLGNHLLITGTTGSGKSTSALSILTALKRNNQNTIIIDATGEYKNIENATVAKLGENAFIDYTKLDNNTWANLLTLNKPKEIKVLAAAILSLKIQKNVYKKDGIYSKVNRKWTDFKKDSYQLFNYPQPFNINLLGQQISEELIKPKLDETMNLEVIGQERDFKQLAKWQTRLQQINNTLSDPIIANIFHLPDHLATYNNVRFDIMYLIALFSTHKVVNKTLVIDISKVLPIVNLDQKIVSIIANEVLSVKNKNNKRPVVLFIDEAHRYIPNKNKKISENNGVYKILREGRKFGTYLLLTTQSPLDIPTKLLGQFGATLTHKIKTNTELKRLKIKIPTIISYQPGQALLQGDNYAKVYELQMIKSDEQHATSSPKFS